MSTLKVSANGRRLVRDDGSPFFYLGDTAWAMLQRLDRAETDRYLRDRAARGFTVVQTVAISEFDGLSAPNRNGDLPLRDADPARPNDAYFRHVDWVVERAAGLGLVVALLPTWADKVGPALWGTESEIFTPQNARIYGEFLGRRYRDPPMIWVLGGDRTPTEPRHLAAWRAMAEGLDHGDGGCHPMTFHPQGRSSSADTFPDESWLDFHTIQSGHHARHTPNHARIAADYARSPVKPVLDAEPCYEDHPVDWQPEQGYFGAADVRNAAYWALFAGACGHTYGANGVFQCWTGGPPDKFGARRRWEEALALPGADQMRHARALIASRPAPDRVPDQTLLPANPGDGPDHARATRAVDGRYAFVYLPTGRPTDVSLASLSGSTLDAVWYNPRTGGTAPLGRIARTPDPVSFAPPTVGPDQDWVLILDDAEGGDAARPGPGHADEPPH